jgi:hypothetical protein
MKLLVTRMKYPESQLPSATASAAKKWYAVAEGFLPPD